MPQSKSRLAAVSVAAELLFGERWQRPFARAIDINDRHVRRWVAGQRPVPRWVADKLLELIGDHQAQLTQAEAQLRQLEPQE